MEIEDYFEPKAVNVRNFFRQDNKKYYIPDHQRNYAWTDNELEDLWSDFISVVKNSLDESNGYTEKHNARPYFLGGIVLTKKERNYEIIDGQQRLTTITILAKSLADLARRIDDPHSFTGIINSLKDIYTYSDPLDDFEPFLHLDDSINNFFLNYILTRHTPQERAEYYNRNTPRRKAAELIKGAHDFFLTKLEIEFPQDIDQGVLINKLKGYVKILTRYMSFLKIIVQDRAMAYVIFGSLNKRGKDLSGSDLIKNELFKRETNDRRYSELKNSWDGVINTIENENLTGYIRFQYASKYGNVKPRDLFSTITEHITKTTTPSSYVTELEEESEWFARINSIGTQYWNNSITAKLKTFKKIDITHHTPLLLTGAVKYGDSQADFERLLDSLITFCIRYFTIGSQTVNDLEREIGNMSKYLRAPRKKDEISSKDQPVTKIQDLDDLIAYMESLTPEITFRQNFLQFKTKNNELAFYLLEELEKYKLSGVVPLDQSPSQHLEHIMPRSLSRAKNRQGEWNKVRDLESYNDYKFRLGNLLILESEINQRASNRDFEFKKSCYVDSGLHYPIKITEIEDWNFEKIEERQKDMAEDALLIWNYEN